MNIRDYAYLGDAVWELFVRCHAIELGKNSKNLHKYVTSKVNASFQHELINRIETELTDEERDLVRRGRNLSIPVARRKIQEEYRYATAFEVLIGYWYKTDIERLKYFEEILKKFL